MKKHLFLLITLVASLTASAQSRGLKIAYIDMEYILEKVPDYAEAKNQLELKAGKWKQEIEAKKNDINKLKDNLKTEKVLLTKELIQEREEEISFLENDLITYQDKRFGPKGDLISQKSVLVKPIQDQVFTIVQDISELKKYDFVFDKSSDLTMLFAAQRHDISDLVVRRLTRSAKREQLSGKEIKKLEEQEAKEDLADDPDYNDKQKIQEEKKAARQKRIDDQKAAADARKAEARARREQALQARADKRKGSTATGTGTTAPANNTNNQDDLNSGDDAPPANANRTGTNTTGSLQPQQPVQGENSKEVKTTATEVPEEGTAESVNRQNNAQERNQKLEERKRVSEENRQKKLADREAAKKARQDKKKAPAQEENKNEN
jgi:Skp family chaperone for outer membrane proteins